MPRCEHPVHHLNDPQQLMLNTAVVTVQEALWGHHAPTVFGNSKSALDAVKSLASAIEYDDHRDTPASITVHHAPDGCFHAHFGTRAIEWHDHLMQCPND